MALLLLFPLLPLRFEEETLDEHRELAEQTDVAPDGATVVAAAAVVTFAPSVDVDGPIASPNVGPGPGNAAEGTMGSDILCEALVLVLVLLVFDSLPGPDGCCSMYVLVYC